VAKNQHLEVQKVRLRITLLQTWPERTTCAVRVVIQSGNISKENIEMVFESEKRSGGGEVEECYQEPDGKSVVITFKSRKGIFFCFICLCKN